ncbi:MAG: pentapeptide repeat-containing protein, partial [Actinomycetes bacterium]
MRLHSRLFLAGTLTAALAISGCSSQTSSNPRELSGSDSASPSASPTTSDQNDAKHRDCGGIPLIPNADLRGCDFHDANLSGKRLMGADLTNAILTNAHLNSTMLVRANLTNVKLTGATLSGAELSGALLSGVISGGIAGAAAKLPGGWKANKGFLLGPGANLAGANLTSVSLEQTDLSNANLTGANLTDNPRTFKFKKQLRRRRTNCEFGRFDISGIRRPLGSNEVLEKVPRITIGRLFHAESVIYLIRFARGNSVTKPADDCGVLVDGDRRPPRRVQRTYVRLSSLTWLFWALRQVCCAGVSPARFNHNILGRRDA